MPTELVWGILIAAVLAVSLWGPYLWKEIRQGKVELGPRTPTGTGDAHPGTRSNPAPGQPDGQADPYDPAAQREAPHIKS
jgi:hypothetical protein